MRTSSRNPRLSAYVDLEGCYDFNSYPLAPPGCRMIAYEDRGQCGSWGSKGVRGFYLGPARDHCGCAQVYILSTRSKRVIQTAEFYPHLCAVPTVSPANKTTRAAHHLSDALR